MVQLHSVMRRRRLISLFLSLPVALAGGWGMRAEENVQTVRFRIESSNLEAGFGENDLAMATLRGMMIASAPSEVRVLAAASPDGPAALNARLARERADAAVAFLRSVRPSLPDDVFKVTVVSEDVKGTMDLIRDCGQPWAEEALKILSRGGTSPEEGLRRLEGGAVWQYLAQSVYPVLRRAEVEIVFPGQGAAASDSGSSGTTPSESGIPVESPDVSGIRDSQEGIISSSGGEPLLRDDIPPDNENKGGSSVPGWAWGLIGVLGAGALAFGALFAREKRNNSSPSPPANTFTPVSPPKTPTKPNPVTEPRPASPPKTPTEPKTQTNPKPEVEPKPAAPSVPNSQPKAPSAPATPKVVPPVVAVSSRDGAFLSRINALIAENISNPSFGVDDLAAAVGISRIHLNRRLQNEAGTSPSALLKNARMSMASELLLSGKMSVGEIASKCGFSSLAYFSSAFKEFYGETPSEYVRNH